MGAATAGGERATVASVLGHVATGKEDDGVDGGGQRWRWGEKGWRHCTPWRRHCRRRARGGDWGKRAPDGSAAPCRASPACTPPTGPSPPPPSPPPQQQPAPPPSPPPWSSSATGRFAAALLLVSTISAPLARSHRRAVLVAVAARPRSNAVLDQDDTINQV
uniref:Uncharacterized protein n=1 Tax=Oryza sativa subsp. japonica TaxID=39947 RepID=Q6EQ69_ORYSJ|nr:hypothetical protein [Oryza sativa Japonica Group]BAD29201.1 hypothetical protein [Oryza sativa Japonica Group]